MQLLNHRLLKKTLVISMVTTGAVSLVTITTAIGLFKTVDHFHNYLDQKIYQLSGYHFGYDKLNTGFNHSLQPEIIITGLNIYAKSPSQPLLKINKIQAALSYHSLINLSPVLSELNIESSNIILEYDRLDNLVLNKHIITNLNTPSKPSTFDFDKLLLSQQQISIRNINLALYDSKHYPRVIHFTNIGINLTNQQQEHKLLTKLKLGQNTRLELSTTWQGNKVWDIRGWQTGTINLHSMNDFGYLIKLSSQIKNGSILTLKTKFDSNKQNFAKYGNNIQNFTDFAGAIKIEQNQPGHYEINARKLTINTKTGYLFKDARISGNYTSTIGGNLSLDTINLEGINSVLEIYPVTSKLNLTGSANLGISWESDFSNPQHFKLLSQIKNLTVKSQESNIPSINNINAVLKLTSKQSDLNLLLNNSQINYPKYLYQPIKISNFNTQISLNSESLNNLKISWESTNLKTTDFNISTNGNYVQESNFTDLHLAINNLNLAQVHSYLPRTLSKSVVQKIKNSITTGKLTNGKITLRGSLNNFPFKNDQQGIITFDALINNTSYRFMPEWNPISKINANLHIDNQDVKLIINSGQIGAVTLRKSIVQVPQWNHPQQLIVKGYATGSTNDYLDYLLTTPFAAIVNQTNNQAMINGSSKLEVKLDLPFKHPDQLRLNGKFTPEKNSVTLKSMPLSIEDINGNINFSQKGIEPGKIAAKTLNSNLEIKLDNQQIDVSSPNLDYKQIVHFAYPPAESIISGHAAMLATYSLKEHSLTINSPLQGVTIDAIAPLSKKESEISPLQIKMQELADQNRVVNLSYANQLFSHAELSPQLSLKHLNLAIGTQDYRLSNHLESAVITAKINSERFSFTDWAEFGMKFAQAKTSESTTLTIESENEATIANSPKTNIYPIQVEINSNGFWAKNYNLDAGQLSATIMPESIVANINTPDIKGSVNYQTTNNYLKINLHRLLFSSANFESSPIIATSESSNQIHLTMANTLESQLVNNNESYSLTRNYIKYESSNNTITLESSDFIIEQKTKHKPVSYPNVDLNIDSLYLQNHYFGSVRGSIYTESNSLYLESMTITNEAATTKVSMSDNCLDCDNEYVAIIVHSDINDFGLLLNKLDQGEIFSKGAGKFDANLGWQGGLADFDIAKLHGQSSLNITKGQLVKVNPGLFGNLLGVISISNYATSLNPMGLNNFFGKGFAFDSLNTNLYLANQNIKIEKFEMVGPIASVSTFGSLDFTNKQIDTFLTLEPRLGGTVATTAGIITLNPFVGMFVYAAEYLIGDPINKALAVSFHITGNMESPTMTQTKIDKQIINNFGSSLNIFSTINSKISNKTP